MRQKQIFISAGEPSGDMHAARMIAQLRNILPCARLSGIGGPCMRGSGVELLCEMDRLAVMGLAEVVSHLGFFLGLLARIRRHLRQRRPSLVVLVDFPDFNLRIAGLARSLGIPVLYYISPQVWAWRPGRKKKIARLANQMAVVFPFEVGFYADQPLEVEFVGHPLMEALQDIGTRNDFCLAHGLDPGRPLVGLMPGSRPQEVHRHLGDIQAAAERMARKNQELQFVLGLLPNTSRALGSETREKAARLGVREIEDDSLELIAHSSLLITKSGTTTVEAALLGTPMVIAYRTSGLSYALARRLVKVPFIGMPNLLDDQAAIPELIQDSLQPDALAKVALEVLEDSSPLRRSIIEQCARVRSLLQTEKPASLRVAEIICRMCGQER